MKCTCAHIFSYEHHITSEENDAEGGQEYRAPIIYPWCSASGARKCTKALPEDNASFALDEIYERGRGIPPPGGYFYEFSGFF